MSEFGQLDLPLPNGQVKRLKVELPVTEKTVLDTVEGQWPELWAKCYPRVYDDARIADHYSAKTLGFDLAGAVIGRLLAFSMETDSNRSTAYDFILANQLARFQVPTFFLSRALAEAIRHTTPPVAIEWHDMQLPFDAAVFMLPRGVLRHPSDGADCAYVAYARCKQGMLWDAPLVPGSKFGILNGGFLVMTSTVSPRRMYHYHWPYSHETEQCWPRIQLNDLEEATASHGDDTSRFFFPEGMMAEDSALVLETAHYVFGTLLIMMNRSDLVQSGRLLKRVAKNGRSTREFWSPNILGAEYRVARAHAAAAGTGSSPRMHWRRGHWRQQPHGPNRSLRRDTWIEPVLVNAE